MSLIVDQYGRPTRFAHAADRNIRRGPQFSVRNEDIDRLIPSGDRKTLASLSNRLFMNMGVPRACIMQKADYAVGEAWIPAYKGPDKELGKGVAKFMHDVWLPQCDVRGGVYDWWKLLELSSISMDRDGDLFWVMIKGEDNFPRIELIPGHRCYSEEGQTRVKGGEYDGFRINDGVIYFRGGRPAAYQFNVGKEGKEEMRVVPAADVIHLFDPTHSEQGRGLPAFTHALESLKMSLLSTEDERIRQQIVSRLHLTIFNESGAPDLDDPSMQLSNTTSNMPASFSTKSFPGGIQYMPAEGNQRIEQMKHENPGPIWDSFQDRINRDAIIPVWSYNVWKGGGQGTEARGEIVKCRRFVTKRQGVLWYAAKRAFSWAYSVFVENGRTQLLEKPTAWAFSYPPRLSVDDGRESAMELNELVTGSRNLDEVLAARGIDEDQFLYDRAWIAAKRKIIAAQVSEDASKQSGYEIKVDEREMFMQTPNEMPSQDEPEQINTQESNDDEP